MAAPSLIVPAAYPASPTGPCGLADVLAPRPPGPADSARNYASRAELQRPGSAPFPGPARPGPWPGASGGGEAAPLACAQCLGLARFLSPRAGRPEGVAPASGALILVFPFVPFPERGIRLALNLRPWPSEGNGRAMGKRFCIHGGFALGLKEGLLLCIPALSLPSSHWSDLLRAQSENYVPRAIKLFTEPL